MKPNSISGITINVADLSRSSAFYRTVGFREGKTETDRITFYVNWFWITLAAQRGDLAPDPGAGMTTHLKVDDVDAFYQDVVDAGITPDSTPVSGRGGVREFTMRDPDGYRLVFFQK